MNTALHLRGGKHKQLKTKNIVVKDVDRPHYQEYVITKLQDMGVRVIDVNIDKNGEFRNYILTIEYSNEIKEDDIISMVEYDCLLKI